MPGFCVVFDNTTISSLRLQSREAMNPILKNALSTGLNRTCPSIRRWSRRNRLIRGHLILFPPPLITMSHMPNRVIWFIGLNLMCVMSLFSLLHRGSDTLIGAQRNTRRVFYSKGKCLCLNPSLLFLYHHCPSVTTLKAD